MKGGDKWSRFCCTVQFYGLRCTGPAVVLTITLDSRESRRPSSPTPTLCSTILSHPQCPASDKCGSTWKTRPPSTTQRLDCQNSKPTPSRSDGVATVSRDSWQAEHKAPHGSPTAPRRLGGTGHPRRDLLRSADRCAIRVYENPHPSTCLGPWPSANKGKRERAADDPSHDQG